jgi:hypothetical protein
MTDEKASHTVDGAGLNLKKLLREATTLWRDRDIQRI